MNNGHGTKKALIPLVQTVFLSKKSMGVKEVERFSATAFVDDITNENGKIWLEGKYEIHFDYYGIEGEKLYKERVKLPLRAELSADWKFVNGESINLKIDCKKLQVLTPYVLEFGGNLEVLWVENRDKEDNKDLYHKTKQIVDFDRKQVSKTSADSYKPDPVIEKILAEYETGGLEDVFWDKNLPKAENNDNTETESADFDAKPIKTVADLSANRMLAENSRGILDELQDVADNKPKEKTEVKSDMGWNRLSRRQKKTANPQAVSTTESQIVDLTDLKARSLDKLKQNISVNNDLKKSDEVVLSVVDDSTEIADDVNFADKESQSETAAQSVLAEDLQTEELVTEDLMANVDVEEVFDEVEVNTDKEASREEIGLSSETVLSDLTEIQETEISEIVEIIPVVEESMENVAETQETESLKAESRVEEDKIISTSGLVVELKMKEESNNGFIISTARDSEPLFYLKYIRNNDLEVQGWQKV